MRILHENSTSPLCCRAEHKRVLRVSSGAWRHAKQSTLR